MLPKIVYIADLDQDVDDLMAALYLRKSCLLDYVVCAPEPVNEEGLKRKKRLEFENVQFCSEIKPGADIVFSGGGLRPVLEYIENGNRLDLLVMNGGFAGENVSDYVLEKFKGKEFVRTFNFNVDVEVTDKVLSLPKKALKKIVLVGKNVCHSELNTTRFLWSDMRSFPRYTHENKRLHDVLACHEGLSFVSSDYERLCNYCRLYPVTSGGLNGNMTLWGSSWKRTKYRQCLVAVGFTDRVLLRYKPWLVNIS